MKPLISFVIPVHNNSLFEFSNCIRSIQKIKKLKYEIIIVDNNSDSRKSKIYKNIVENAKNITYFYTKKKGVGLARNIGINHANGEYIFFADADDEIIPNIFDVIMIDRKVDLYIFDILVKNSKTTSILRITTNNSSINISEQELAYNIVMGFYLNNVFGRLFKKEFLVNHSIYFNNMKNGEDVTFMRDVIILEPVTRHIQKNAYIYFEKVKNSNMRVISDPLGAYEDSKRIFKLKSSLAKKFKIDTQNVICVINQEYIKAISNTYFDLWNVNSTDSNQAKTFIVNDISKFKRNSNYSHMINLRLHILKRQNRIMIKVFCLLRKYYLRTFKS